MVCEALPSAVGAVSLRLREGRMTAVAGGLCPIALGEELLLLWGVGYGVCGNALSDRM